MSDIDLAAIRARADAAWDEHSTPRDLLASADDVPALLALVDAQAARIEKALAALGASVHSGDGMCWCLKCVIRRALTEDTR